MWYIFVYQFKYEWDVAKGPYTRFWSAVGDGAPTKIADIAIPNSYNESCQLPSLGGPRHDLWNVTDKGWGSSSTRTVYTKGVYIFKDEPGTPQLSLDLMLALIRSK